MQTGLSISQAKSLPHGNEIQGRMWLTELLQGGGGCQCAFYANDFVLAVGESTIGSCIRHSRGSAGD